MLSVVKIEGPVLVLEMTVSALSCSALIPQVVTVYPTAQQPKGQTVVVVIFAEMGNVYMILKMLMIFIDQEIITNLNLPN
jgi:hypothetical protein